MQWSQNLCRACGQISEACHYIFENDPLLEKFKMCSNVKVSKTDFKPKQICNSCVGKLNDFSDFLQTIQRTNTKLESIFLTASSQQSTNLLTDKAEITEKRHENPDKFLENYEAIHNLNFLKENVPNYPKRRGRYTAVEQKERLSQPVTKDILDKSCIVSYKNDLTPESSVFCVAMQKKYPVYKILNKRFKCCVCDKKCTRRVKLSPEGIKSFDIKPRKCKQCLQESTSDTVRDELECSSCRKVFKTPGRLARHEKTHLIYQKVVKSYGKLLSKKMRSKAVNLEFKCDLCFKDFKYRGTLLNHLKRHNNSCPYCKTNCHSVSILRQHLKMCRHRI